MTRHDHRPLPTGWILAAIAVIAGAGCEGPMDLNLGGSETVYPRSAFMDVDPQEVSLPWDDTIQLSATYTDTLGGVHDDLPFTWSSDDPEVATVDDEGEVVGVSMGWAVIRASYSGRSALADIAVVLGDREWPGEMQLARLSLGWSHACGAEDDGSLHCWGNNEWGQLALGAESRGSMVPMEAAHAPALARVASGSWHACGLTDAGQPFCWGRNDHGGLGDGTTVSRTTPTPVSGDLILETVAPGEAHTCGLDPDGHAWCWGGNFVGELGTGDTIARTEPARVETELTFRSIATQLALTCALTAEGAAHCWGALLEDGPPDPHPLPEPVATGFRFSALDVGGGRICGVEDDGDLWCWGHNPITFGLELEPRLLATESPLRPETLSMHPEGQHGCALDESGNAWCWGDNLSGKLGDGTQTGSADPVRVAGDLRFRAIAAGVNSTCGLTVDRVAYCWGANSYGELGTGDVTGSSAPRRVVGQS